MSEKKPIVLRAVPLQRVCPVCGKASYSPAGTHPQCSVARADAISREARKVAEVEVSKAPRKLWSKPCPKCKRQIPARRIVCDCGHNFGSVPTSEAVAPAKLSRKVVARKPR
jgi:hypothetical protein